MNRTIVFKFAITTVSLGILAALHRFEIEATSTDWGLIVIAFLPWLAYSIDSAELPGGWKVKFRELKDETESLKFLVAHFVTDDEITHLKKLEAQEAFPFAPDSPEAHFFKNELRRLRSFRLIEGQKDKGIRTLENEGGDVRNHFRITERGRQYLKLRAEMNHADT